MASAVRPTILFLVGNTLDRSRRSGIHRVVVETARALSGLGSLDLVRWDLQEGRLRFLDTAEIDCLFGAGAWPPGIRVRPECRSTGRPFRELLDDPRSTWLLTAEVWHEKFGADVLARSISHCRDWGGRFASVFYDLIPMTNPVYSGGACDHEAYLGEILRTDLVLPISHYAGQTLVDLWRSRGLSRTPEITALPLPDSGFVPPDHPRPVEGERTKRIVLTGTIEPRKRQVQFIEAMDRARKRSRAAREWDVVAVGSVHPYSAEAFNAQVAGHRWLTHRDYVEDAELAALLQDCGFTAFVSDDEGYGLPIAESLAFGSPCLCASFGSMAEIAAGGGCFTVDVRDPDALENAIVQMCETPSLLLDLRRQIEKRRFRGWTDYAREIVDLVTGAHARLQAAAPVELRIEQAPMLAPGDTLERPAFERLAQADIVCLPDDASRKALIAEAARHRWPSLLPTRLALGDGLEDRRQLADERAVRQELAEVEATFARNRRLIDPAFKIRPAFLRILISTYNRREFVLKNARWILDTVMAAGDLSIEFRIFDGASTDQTVEALQAMGDSRLWLDQAAANAGMLGGIREAAKAPGAEYVWLVGDDDFLIPEEALKVLAALKAHRGISFAFTNFSVYHRQSLTPADTPQGLIAEATPIAAPSAPSGIMKVREAAGQTDNLFTAIYSIIWRADLLSSAFEHSFRGPPFANLTEAIPCTEFVLKRYAECDAYWHATPAIAGNAHNSWRRHRPRWHGAVMPMAFALARDAGVDPALLQEWADMHARLLDEALDIAKAEGYDPRLHAADDALAQAVFRRPLPGMSVQ